MDAQLTCLVERGDLARSPRETGARSIREYLTATSWPSAASSSLVGTRYERAVGAEDDSPARSVLLSASSKGSARCPASSRTAAATSSSRAAGAHAPELHADEQHDGPLLGPPAECCPGSQVRGAPQRVDGRPLDARAPAEAQGRG